MRKHDDYSDLATQASLCGAGSRTVHFEMYAPTSVVVELSRPHSESLAEAATRGPVGGACNGLMSAPWQRPGSGLIYDGDFAPCVRLRMVSFVSVAGVVLAQVIVTKMPVVGAQLPAAITSSSFSTVSQDAGSAIIQQSLKQEGDNADVHAALFYRDGTHESLIPPS